MTQYREVNTGQIIDVTGEREAHIAAQARWVLADGSQDPVAPKTGADLDPDNNGVARFANSDIIRTEDDQSKPETGAQPDTENKATDVPTVSVGDNEDDGKPAASASKADWEAYAREQGKDEDAIEAATKAEIQAWFK